MNFRLSSGITLVLTSTELCPKVKKSFQITCSQIRVDDPYFERYPESTLDPTDDLCEKQPKIDIKKTEEF